MISLKYAAIISSALLSVVSCSSDDDDDGGGGDAGSLSTGDLVIGTSTYTDSELFSADAGSTTIIDFDEQTASTLLTGDEYPGLTIQSRNISVVNPQDLSPGLTVGAENVNSQPNGISASLAYSGSSIVFDNLDDNFTFLLSEPATSVGIWAGNLGASNSDGTTATSIAFYDESGNEIYSVQLTQTSPGLIGSGANNRIFSGIRSEVPIASIVVENASSDGDGIILDGFEYKI